MIDCEPKKISKEIYNRAMANRNYICDEDKRKIFSEAQLFGYGIYGARAFERDGEYWCAYSMGSSCD